MDKKNDELILADFYKNYIDDIYTAANGYKVKCCRYFYINAMYEYICNVDIIIWFSEESFMNFYVDFVGMSYWKKEMALEDFPFYKCIEEFFTEKIEDIEVHFDELIDKLQMFDKSFYCDELEIRLPNNITLVNFPCRNVLIQDFSICELISKEVLDSIWNIPLNKMLKWNWQEDTELCKKIIENLDFSLQYCCDEIEVKRKEADANYKGNGVLYFCDYERDYGEFVIDEILYKQIIMQKYYDTHNIDIQCINIDNRSIRRKQLNSTLFNMKGLFLITGIDENYNAIVKWLEYNNHNDDVLMFIEQVFGK